MRGRSSLPNNPSAPSFSSAFRSQGRICSLRIGLLSPCLVLLAIEFCPIFLLAVVGHGSCLVLLFVSQFSFLFTDSLQVRGLGFPFRRSRSEAVHDYAATYLMDEISLMALDIFFFFVTLASRQSASFARALLDLIVVDGKANR